MSTSILLEIAVFNIESALQAMDAGANRIEFCENPQEGGTTPSYGSLQVLAKLASIPVFPIIRPRGGDFLYSKYEFDSIKEDLIMIKELDYPGAVIGFLNSDGSIDIDRTTELVALAGEMEITFHRAFDRCNNAVKGLEAIIQTGCKRILTSGQVPNANDALPILKQLVDQAGDRIIIMPGSGVRANNIEHIIQSTGAKEIHSSARKMFPSKMNFNQSTMQEQMQFTGVDENEIIEMLAKLDF
jgi:copper homeostasis protein